MKTVKWDIFEELKTEEDIQAFVEASIVEAQNDTDPKLLAHTLEVAVKAREMLALRSKTAKRKGNVKTHRSRAKISDPRISTFDKIARTLGYHLTLAPIQNVG